MKKIDRGTVILLAIVLIAIVALIISTRNRQSQLDNNFSISSAKIIEVKLNATKGTHTTRNIAKYNYTFRNVKYNKMVEIYERDIKIDECYEIKIANENPNNSKINLNKKIDCYE